MQRYLVVSYDGEQRQWFWECVAAQTAEDAVILVCQARPYVIAADAASLSQVAEITHGSNLYSVTRTIH